MTLSAIVSKPVLEEFVNPLSEFVNEAAISITAEGLEVQAVDPANVALVDVTLDAAAFESYDAEETTVGLNVDRLEDALSYVGSGDLVQLKLNGRRQLDIKFGGADLSLSTIDPGSIRTTESPTLELPTRVIPDGDQFATGVDVVQFATDDDEAALVSWTGDQLRMNAVGDTEEASIAFDRAELISVKATEQVRSHYSVPYLKSAAKPLDAESELELSLGQEMPLELQYDIAEGLGSVAIQIAPRVDGGDA